MHQSAKPASPSTAHTLTVQAFSDGVWRDAICNNTRSGSHMRHEEVVGRLAELWAEAGQEAELENLVFEYVRRDLLTGIPPAIRQASGRLPVLRLEASLKDWGLL